MLRERRRVAGEKIIEQKCVICDEVFQIQRWKRHVRKVCSDGCSKALKRSNHLRFDAKNPGYMKRINDQRRVHRAAYLALKRLGISIEGDQQ